MRKTLKKLHLFKEAKPVANTGSSSTSPSDQQRVDTRQPNAPAATGQPSANIVPILAASGDDNSQNAPVGPSGARASTPMTTLSPRNNNRQDQVLAAGGEISANTAEAPVPPSNPPNVDHLGEKDNYGIKVLYSSASAVIDIIFIHGLTGSAYTTWLHEGSGVHWPRDLLKNDLKDARIMTFGYDADVVNFWNHAAQDGVTGYANDLLGSLAGRREGISVRMIPSSIMISNLREISDKCSRKTAILFSSFTVLAVWSHSGL
jgi:hypothetical protein